MPRFFALIFAFLLAGCAGNNFDEASFPPDQLATELAFKRMADHGGLEPVVEIGQEFTDWQFHVAAFTQASLLNGAPTTEFTLRDRSGIEYTVSSASNPEAQLQSLNIGHYGYASGKFVSVERDFTAGKVFATLVLERWREGKSE